MHASHPPLGPLCEAHWAEVFPDKTTVPQHLTEGFYHVEEPEPQNLGCSYVEDIYIKQDALEQEDPEETSIATKNDTFLKECARRSPSSPALICCDEESWSFTEQPLAGCAARESALRPERPQSCFYENDGYYNVEGSAYGTDRFDLHDLRVSDKAEEVRWSMVTDLWAKKGCVGF